MENCNHNYLLFENLEVIQSDMKNYLNVAEDSPNLNCLYMLAKHYKQKKDKFLTDHFDIINEYNKLIKLLSHLINDIGIKDDITSYYTVYTYLLWNGYLSKYQNFKYSNEDLLNIIGYDGLDVLFGSGNCRSISSLLNTLFKSLDIDTHFLINSNVFNNNQKDSDRIGNHASVLVKENKNYYIYDSTNLLVFKVNEDLKGELYTNLGNSFIKPWGFIIYENMNQKEVLNLIRDIKKQDIKSYKNSEEIKNTIDESLNICHNNKRLILDFHKQVLEGTNNISKYL